MLIGMTVMDLCQLPSRSITVLGAVDGVATFGAWLTSVFSSVSYVSIICLSTFYLSTFNNPNGYNEAIQAYGVSASTFVARFTVITIY